MAKTVNLGKKQECGSCGTKFYDFGKPDPACPKCDTSLNEEPEAEVETDEEIAEPADASEEE